MSEMNGVTPGKVWRRGKVITLPSGNVAMLRKPDPMKLIREPGEAPNILSGKIEEMIQGKAPKMEIELNANTLPDVMAVFDKLCKVCFVEPRIVDKPEADDEISALDVDFSDKLFIFKWAFGGEGDAALTFPGQPVAGVGPASDGS